MTDKLNTSGEYNELYGERGQKLSKWEGGMARRRASKIRRVKAATRRESGGGDRMGTRSPTRFVWWGRGEKHSKTVHGREGEHCPYQGKPGGKRAITGAGGRRRNA